MTAFLGFNKIYWINLINNGCWGCFSIGIGLISSMFGYLGLHANRLSEEGVKHPTNRWFKRPSFNIFKYIPWFVRCLLCLPCHFVYDNASFPWYLRHTKRGDVEKLFLPVRGSNNMCMSWGNCIVCIFRNFYYPKTLPIIIIFFLYSLLAYFKFICFYCFVFTYFTLFTHSLVDLSIQDDSLKYCALAYMCTHLKHERRKEIKIGEISTCHILFRKSKKKNK